MIEIIHIKLNGYSVPVTVINLSTRIISIPTQIGCLVGCTFCISSQNKFIRNLTHDEISYIIDSVGVDNNTVISFSGEGEPLLNIQKINKIIDLYYSLCKGFKLCISGAKIQNLDRLIVKDNIELQFSLHAADEDIRSSLIPLSVDLITIKKYIIKNSHKFNLISINYVIMKDNSDNIMIDKLINYIEFGWMVKLSPLLNGENNEVLISEIYNKLCNNNVLVKIYNKLGIEISKNYKKLTYEVII